MMLNLLIIAGAAYLFYVMGVRFAVRAQLFASRLFDLIGYACSMAAGTTVSLYAVLTAMDMLSLGGSAGEVSLFSTALSVCCGEFLYARISRLSFKLLAPLRSKEGER